MVVVVQVRDPPVACMHDDEMSCEWPSTWFSSWASPCGRSGLHSTHRPKPRVYPHRGLGNTAKQGTRGNAHPSTLCAMRCSDGLVQHFFFFVRFFFFLG